MKSILLFTMAFLICSAGIAQAQATEDEWEYRLTPYLWFAGLKGDIATIPPLPAAPIDVSPSDAVEDTEVSLMFLFDAKKGRHGINFGLTYSDTRSDEEGIPPPINLEMQSITKTTIGSLAYQYEVHRDQRSMVDVLAGARYWSIDSTLKFSKGLGILDGRRIKHDESWFDPAVGIKGITYLGSSSKYYVSGSAGLGGFGVGSDMFYDLNINLGYQLTDSIGTALGYRMFDVDYEEGDFLYDARQHGFLLSLTWKF